MNSEQINLVQATFKEVRLTAAVAATAAETFYARLFVIDPSLRVMFKGDLVHQGRMLMTMLNSAVNGLTNINAMLPVVRHLGVRHARYGVNEAHYATVGNALLWMLEQRLGEKFSPDVREAWVAAYELLADAMKKGAAAELPSYS